MLRWKSFWDLYKYKRAARNSPVHSNSVINYAIAVRLFRTVMRRDRLKNFSGYNFSYGIRAKLYGWAGELSAVCKAMHNIHTRLKIFSSKNREYCWFPWGEFVDDYPITPIRLSAFISRALYNPIYNRTNMTWTHTWNLNKRCIEPGA